MRASRGIRVAAWVLVVGGVAAPVLRRRLSMRPAAVLGTAGLAPLALCVAVPRSRGRQLAVCGLNMWAYIAAYELPHDNPEALERRVAVRYPMVLDQVLGLGKLPTVRLQEAFSTPGAVNRFERVLAGFHWVWFRIPHLSVLYSWLRDPERFPSAAARMYSVFDTGAIFYWTIPTAPPWWAAAKGTLPEGQAVPVRRMMIEYGPEFWGPMWDGLYSFLGGNPLAAMPSLHFATSLMAAHLLSEVGPLAGAVGWGYLVMLGLALVYLGEHYAVDLLGGALLTETIRRLAPRLTPAARRISSALFALELRAAG